MTYFSCPVLHFTLVHTYFCFQLVERSYSLCSPLVKRFSTMKSLSNESHQWSEPKLLVVSCSTRCHANCSRVYLGSDLSGCLDCHLFWQLRHELPRWKNPKNTAGLEFSVC